MRAVASLSRLQRLALIGVASVLPFLAGSNVRAQTPEAESSELAEALAEALGSSDFVLAGTMLSPDAVVTFQNGDTRRGRDEIVGHVKGLFVGTGALVQAYSGTPVVTGVAAIDDTTRVVIGTSADSLTLSSGAPMVIETRWTATIISRDGAWKIASLHLSTNMLDNPIIEKMKTTSYLLGAFGFVMGITVGIGLSMLFRRRAAPSRSGD